MVTSPSSDPGAVASGRQSLTPAEARQDATDRLIGRRTLLALRVVAVITALTFGTAGILTDPEIAGSIIDSEALRALGGEVFALLGVSGLVAVLVCRQPSRRQSWWLTRSIGAAGAFSLFVGGIGLLGNIDGVVATALFTVSAVSGLATLVLLYVWRARKVS